MPTEDLFELDFEDEGLEAGFTTVQNVFIVHYMPPANANYVKVYLAGLARCFGSRSEQWASVRTLAEEQQISVDTVRRAWRYWEKVGLIRRIPRYVKDTRNLQDYRTEPDTEYCYQVSSIIRFRRNLKAPTERALGGMQPCTPPLCTAAYPPYAAVHTIEEIQTEEIQGQDKTGSGLVASSLDTEGASPDEVVVKMERVTQCFVDVVGREASQLEQEHLTRLIGTYGWWEVEKALNELLVQRDLQHIGNPTRYLAGVLENWSKEGPRNTDILAHLRRMNKG